MGKWYKSDFEEAFYFEKEKGKIVCSLHPKETKEYAFFLLNNFFDSEEKAKKWYTTKNFWYGDISPEQMTKEELFDRIFQMITGTYI